jgi:PAS domain S-box-containing protein
MIKEILMGTFSVWAIVHIFSAILYLNLIIIILISDFKASANRLAAALLACFAAWSFNEFLLTNISMPMEYAYIIERINSVSWIIFPLFAAMLFLTIAEDKNTLKSAIFRFYTIAAPAFILYLSFSDKLMKNPVLRSKCWFSDWRDGIWPNLYFAFYFFTISFGVFRGFVLSRRTLNVYKKNEINFLIIITLVTLVIGTFLEIIVPSLYVKGSSGGLLDLTNSYLIIWAAGIIYAMLRYRTFRISPTQAADDIVRNISDILLLLDRNMNIVYANSAACSTLKYKQDDLTGLPFLSIINEKDMVKIINPPGLIKNMDIELMASDRTPAFVSFSISMMHDSSDPHGFILVARDISERRIYEERIKHERDNARAYLETAGVMFVLLGRDGDIKMANKKTVEKLGYASETELLGKNWLASFIPDEKMAEFKSSIDSCFAGATDPLPLTTYMLCHGVPRIMVKWNFTQIKRTGENSDDILCAGDDITVEYKNADRLNKLSTAVRQSPVSIVITDTQGNITYVNPKFTEITGYSEDEAYGKNPRILKSGEMSLEDYKKMWEQLLSGKPWHGEFHNKRKDGSLFWENASINPVRDLEGNITSYLAVKEDITGEKLVREELKVSYEKLKELDVLKENFMSMVSHELRTPITSIKGFLSLILGGSAGPVNPAQREFIEIIKNNSDRLLMLINDLLDVSKMESGAFTITKKETDLIPVIKNAIKDISSIVARKHIDISVEGGETPLIFPFDDYRISQTIINLLNNSIKFSRDNSHIIISVKKSNFSDIAVPGHAGCSFPPDSRFAVIGVRDFGIGFPPEYAEKIFNRFYQVENVNSRTHQGTGLGLSIVKSIIELHGGCVWAESEGLDKGAVFVLIIPLLS